MTEWCRSSVDSEDGPLLASPAICRVAARAPGCDGAERAPFSPERGSAAGSQRVPVPVMAAVSSGNEMLKSRDAAPTWAKRFSIGDTPPLSKLLQMPPASAAMVDSCRLSADIPPFPPALHTPRQHCKDAELLFSTPPRAVHDPPLKASHNPRCSQAVESSLCEEQLDEIDRFLCRLQSTQTYDAGAEIPSRPTCYGAAPLEAEVLVSNELRNCEQREHDEEPREEQDRELRRTKEEEQEEMEKVYQNSLELPLPVRQDSYSECAEESIVADLKRLPCRICGRHFLEGRLKYHEDVCEKASALAVARRAAFDSRLQRCSKLAPDATDVLRTAATCGGTPLAEELQQFAWRRPVSARSSRTSVPKRTTVTAARRAASQSAIPAVARKLSCADATAQSGHVVGGPRLGACSPPCTPARQRRQACDSAPSKINVGKTTKVEEKAVALVTPEKRERLKRRNGLGSSARNAQSQRSSNCMHSSELTSVAIAACQQFRAPGYAPKMASSSSTYSPPALKLVVASRPTGVKAPSQALRRATPKRAVSAPTRRACITSNVSTLPSESTRRPSSNISHGILLASSSSASMNQCSFETPRTASTRTPPDALSRETLLGSSGDGSTTDRNTRISRGSSRTPVSTADGMQTLRKLEDVRRELVFDSASTVNAGYTRNGNQQSSASARSTLCEVAHEECITRLTMSPSLDYAAVPVPSFHEPSGFEEDDGLVMRPLTYDPQRYCDAVGTTPEMEANPTLLQKPSAWQEPAVYGSVLTAVEEQSLRFQERIRGCADIIRERRNQRRDIGLIDECLRATTLDVLPAWLQ